MRKYRKGLFWDSLREKPWQTRNELTVVLGYPAESVVRKGLESGRLVRRVSTRKWSPYEYALAETRAEEIKMKNNVALQKVAC